MPNESEQKKKNKIHSWRSRRRNEHNHNKWAISRFFIGFECKDYVCGFESAMNNGKILRSLPCMSSPQSEMTTTRSLLLSIYTYVTHMRWQFSCYARSFAKLMPFSIWIHRKVFTGIHFSLFSFFLCISSRLLFILIFCASIRDRNDTRFSILKTSHRFIRILNKYNYKQNVKEEI